jgi:CDP-paratose 2-epimerase
MKTVIVTGSLGLIGSESVKLFSKKGFKVIGIDNDMRKYFFGQEASTAWNKEVLEKECPDYVHISADIRDAEAINKVFAGDNENITAVIHTAAQPSHDWAAKEPITDFTINAVGTLNMLEATRKYCPKAVFIFTSTNKVYGDAPNRLPLIELEKRYELPTYGKHVPSDERMRGGVYSGNYPAGVSENGISESFSIDNCLHSVFGASKVAADIMVQEYGKYFKMNTGIFRCGCLTGPAHSGTELHGFLSYLMKCTMTKTPYKIFGYKGKQVRSNIHSFDLLNAFYEFFLNPKQGEVYNMDGGREVNCSMLEAIEICEKITGNKLDYTYIDEARIGDHQWYVTSNEKFKRDFPNWKITYDIEKILKEIHDFNLERWKI